jgi:NADP-dependent aldehyde dehydrogenase
MHSDTRYPDARHADTSVAARTGTVVETVPVSTPDDVDRAVACATAAAGPLATADPRVRRDWLVALAEGLETAGTRTALVRVADTETALGEPRLRTELARCADQLRFYGEVAAEGAFLAATVDHADGARPDLRRLRVPLGPVAVLGASNFPFGFGVLGHDTASALAAGCPVVAKAHPAHPVTSRLLGHVAREALTGAGAPAGAFGLVSGFDAGTALVRAPQVRAVAFTGSQQGGLALWRAANEREDVVPVYAEMGTVNPVVVTRAGALRRGEVADGFVGSFTLGTGQYCTKPGLLLAPAGAGFPAAVARSLERAASAGWLLTDGIARGFDAGTRELEEAGATVLARVPGPADGWSAAATLLRARAADLRPGSRLLEECFGPVALVVEYDGRGELEGVLRSLPGALAASVMGNGDDDPEVPGLVAALGTRVGRVAVDAWPTGVATTWAQQHGGPWPATTVPSATSVGAAALDRFTRPVAFQSVPEAALPPALHEDNPWRLPRRVDGKQVPA